MSSMTTGLRRAELYTPEYRRLVDERATDDVLLEPWREASGPSLVDVMLEIDTRTYLPGDLLAKIDIATMASSLEARSPLLDHEFLELAASLPASMKVRGREKKVAFRAALRPWLPDEILDRPKQGFSVPLAEWFRGELRGLAEEVLFDKAAVNRGYFRVPEVRRLLDRHASGAEDNSKGIWALMMLELWHKEVVESRRTVSALAPPEPMPG
jgi:asparagine synthase (glutamine-hydrolysing)